MPASASVHSFVVALVLDRPPSEDAGRLKWAALASWFAELGARHLTFVGIDESAIAADRPPGMSIQTLAVGSGRAMVVSAVRELERQSAPASELGTTLERLAGPMPDLVLVFGGRTNLAGALAWHAAYAEFVFLEPSWIEVTREEIARAIQEFAGRDRRFGNVGTGAGEPA